MTEDPAPEKDAFQILAEKLHSEAVPENILKHLEFLVESLMDPLFANHKAMTFLRAGGLRSMIHHLMGILGAQSGSGAMSAAISEKASMAFAELIKHGSLSAAELFDAGGALAPLIDALRDAPTWNARCMSAHALCEIAKAYPAQHVTLAKAGVLGMVVALYNVIGVPASVGWGMPDIDDVLRPAVALVRMLMCSGTVALRDFHDAIAGHSEGQIFAGLVLLQVSQSFSDTDGMLAHRELLVFSKGGWPQPAPESALHFNDTGASVGAWTMRGYCLW